MLGKGGGASAFWSYLQSARHQLLSLRVSEDSVSSVLSVSLLHPSCDWVLSFRWPRRRRPPQVESMRACPRKAPPPSLLQVDPSASSPSLLWRLLHPDQLCVCACLQTVAVMVWTPGASRWSRLLRRPNLVTLPTQLQARPGWRRRTGRRDSPSPSQ